MYCPKNHYLISEIREACMVMVGKLPEKPPDWVNGLPPVQEAISQAILRSRSAVPKKVCHWFPWERYAKTAKHWDDIFYAALEHWLLFRFLRQEKARICLALNSGKAVRLAGNVSHFHVGHLFQNVRESEIFPRDYYGIVALFLSGPPYSRVANPPDYLLRYRIPDGLPSNVFDLELQTLTPLLGSPVVWDGEGCRSISAILQEILDRGLSDDERRHSEEPVNNVPPHRQILQHCSSGMSKSDVRKQFQRLSVRKFELFWRQAAEIDPSIALPGRKSKH